VLLQVAIDPNIQAPELLTALFHEGAQLLIDSLPMLFQGKGMEAATPQDANAATHAAKVGSLHVDCCRLMHVLLLILVLPSDTHTHTHIHRNTHTHTDTWACILFTHSQTASSPETEQAFVHIAAKFVSGSKLV
jgi:hypothetical protein